MLKTDNNMIQNLSGKEIGMTVMRSDVLTGVMDASVISNNLNNILN